MHKSLPALALLIASSVFSTASQAAFHLWQISKVFSDSTGSVQYVEMTALFGGQQFLQSHTLTGSSGTVFTFPANLPGDTAGKTMLLGTAGFASLNVVAPDYILPNNFLAQGGGNVVFDLGYDFISQPAVPPNGFLSADRNGQTVAPTVTNFNGATGTVSIAPPTTPPGAPTGASATSGNGQATIAFTPPTSNGGSAITAYGVSCLPGPVTASGATSPITVTGLTNGTAYTCSATATNAVGTGPASNSTTVTPAGPPGTPVIGSTTPGNGSALIAFTASASNGSPVTGYTATCNPGAITGASGSSPIQVTGLNNGTTYSCTVTATSAAGNSSPSSATSVTPFTTPGAPQATGITAGDGSATLAFQIPADGGSPILSYSATCGPGTTPGSGSGSPIVISGLANGVRYNCTVQAVNAAGPGPASNPLPVVPASVPGAPTISGIVAGDGLASVAFSPPTSNGGAPILLYTVDCGGGSTPVSRSLSPILVTGLTNGVSYSCSVRASNAVGTGPLSAAEGVVPDGAAPLQLIGVFSRKTHASAGIFDLEIKAAPDISGDVSIEPRTAGPYHAIVFRFNRAVTSAAAASATDVANQSLGAVTMAWAGNEITAILPGALNSARAKVAITGVNGVLDVQAFIGFLVGDVVASRSIGASDLSVIKARRGQTLTEANFRLDLNLSGDITSGDLSIAKSRAGAVLP